jgi:hypothetical protein
MHSRRAIQLMLRWEMRRVRLPRYLADTFEEFPPSLVVSTHPMLYHDYEVVTWARGRGIQTIGAVKSWDNIQKGISSHCHLLAVWNPVNKEEATRLLGYRPAEITITGTPSFDPYYHSAYEMGREDAVTSLGLDPLRPIITLATSGPLDKEFYGRDETHLVDDILRMIQESPILRGSQLVIRLHPMSHLEVFWKYWNRPDIKISFASIMPGVMWCPTQQDLMEQVNLLRHSHAILTPGSSWVLEAAIFDTPTIVPTYSDLQPDHAAAQIQRWTLARHYKPLIQNKWVSVTGSYRETRVSLEEAFMKPKEYAKGRRAIVEQYVYYPDSRSHHRVAEWIANVASTIVPGKPRGL